MIQQDSSTHTRYLGLSAQYIKKNQPSCSSGTLCRFWSQRYVVGSCLSQRLDNQGNAGHMLLLPSSWQSNSAAHCSTVHFHIGVMCSLLLLLLLPGSSLRLTTFWRVSVSSVRAGVLPLEGAENPSTHYPPTEMLFLCYGCRQLRKCCCYLRGCMSRAVVCRWWRCSGVHLLSVVSQAHPAASGSDWRPSHSTLSRTGLNGVVDKYNKIMIDR